MLLLHLKLLSYPRVLLFDSSGADYQAILEQLGDRTIPRVKYRPGEILLMSPLPVQGRQAHILVQIVIVLLDDLEQDYEAFTPITMDLPEIRGVEPDYCFYIDNWAAVAGKERIKWGVDPSPDLIIEIDVTSYTDVNDYLPYQVPEAWIFKNNRLLIYGLENNEYQLKTSSRYFPNLNILEIVQDCLRKANERNANTAIRELRQKLAKN